MQRILSVLVTFAWALWFGGLLMLFITVASLFATFDRQPAGVAAAGVFRRFEVYQLCLAAAALLATLAWRLLSGRSRLKVAVLVLFSLATFLAIGSTAFVTPRIEALRLEGETRSPQFQSLHRMSSMFYMAEAALLLVAGLLLPSAIVKDQKSPPARAEDLPIDAASEAEAVEVG